MARRKVLSVVGTRPNLMKIAPIAAEIARRGDELEHVLVHTGQHYDREMSEIFLEELGVGDPDYQLGVGSGSHAQQTAAVMERLEPVLLDAEPDAVLVPGDVNSTMAAAITTSKLGLPLGHVEAGLRSFDRTLPEELNRVVADQLSQFLFIHSPEARDNLLAEQYRQSLRDGHVRKDVRRPAEKDVYRIDPSESIRSDEIMGLVRERFEIVHQADFGGTLLQFVLADIAGNFDPYDAGDVALVNLICLYEMTLIEHGVLPSDFTYVVATAR
jgi:hypothetical protein